MANEVADGFSGYSTAADMTAAGWLTGTGTATATPRFTGGRYAQLAGGGAITHPVTAHATYTLGAAIYLGGTGNVFMGLLDGTTAQVDLRIDATGHLFVTRNGTTLGSVSAGTYSLNTWYYIELKATIHPTTGSYEVRVGETVILSGINQNTRASATNQVTVIRFNGVSGGTFVDDVYANSGAGTLDTGYWGDCKAVDQRPSGDGATIQWTPSTGGNVWSLIDEDTPADTDYGYDGTVGHVHQWTLTSLPTGVGAILAVVTRVRLLKDDAGAHTAAQVIRSGGTDYVQTAVSVADTAATSEIRYATDPATGAAWTVSGANAAQAGIKVAS